MSYFGDLIGQKKAVDLLEQAVACQRIAPAYLFTGASGIGRSLAAKKFVQLVFCQGLPPTKQVSIKQRLHSGNHPDLLWVEPTYLHQGELISVSSAISLGIKRKTPPQIRIEQIRQISQFVSRPPLEVSHLMVVIEDAESMTEAAANALLKTLEEPQRASLILIAPDTESLLPTLVSRCQCIPFTRLSQADLQQILQTKGYQEILDYPEILAIAQGSPGEAIASFMQFQTIPANLLEKLLNLPATSLTCIQLAKEIDRELDTQAQLWLIDYLQYYYWQKKQDANIILHLQKARQYLLRYVQPRLVWECTLLILN
jgi:DNA polymerase-3 subunit delta'